MLCRPLPDDGQEPTAAEYNAELEKRGPLSWLSAPWLFTECYLCMFCFTGDEVFWHLKWEVGVVVADS